MGLFTRTNKDGFVVYGVRYWRAGRDIKETVGPSKRMAVFQPTPARRSED